jgi:hypothetical protein
VTGALPLMAAANGGEAGAAVIDEVALVRLTM